jgi:hypothetical protein
MELNVDDSTDVQEVNESFTIVFRSQSPARLRKVTESAKVSMSYDGDRYKVSLPPIASPALAQTSVQAVSLLPPGLSESYRVKKLKFRLPGIPAKMRLIESYGREKIRSRLEEHCEMRDQVTLHLKRTIPRFLLTRRQRASSRI